MTLSIADLELGQGERLVDALSSLLAGFTVMLWSSLQAFPFLSPPGSNLHLYVCCSSDHVNGH